MRVLVINLDRAKARMAFQQRQLTALGLEWDRLRAVEATQTSDRSETYWAGWQRPLAPAERACLRSHMAAWSRVRDEGVPVLILEDDALLSSRVPAVLEAADGLQDVDLLQLETRQRAKLLGSEAREVGPTRIRPLLMDRAGAAGYVLWPSGAAKALAHVARVPALADAAIATPGLLRAWQSVPAQIIQNDMAEIYGIPPGWPVEPSSVSAVSHRQAEKTAAQKLRRIGAQVGLGLRRITSRGEKVRVPLDSDAMTTTRMSAAGGDGP